MIRLSAPVAILLLALVVGPAGAQGVPVNDPASAPRSRAELERLLTGYEAALAAPEYSQSEKMLIRAQADEIRARLEYGDFRVGDRIWIQVQGETNLPDTVTVQPGPRVTLPVFGEISLAGVLRSEIQPHLRTALSSFIRDPVVRAIPLMRVSIIGSIGRPGFYTLPSETVLADALMLAGGPSQRANLERVRITRGGQDVMERERVREALAAGLTLDQLNLRAGDQIEVPQQGQGLWRTVLTITGAVSSLGFLIWRFAR